MKLLILLLKEQMSANLIKEYDSIFNVMYNNESVTILCLHKLRIVIKY